MPYMEKNKKIIKKNINGKVIQEDKKEPNMINSDDSINDLFKKIKEKEEMEKQKQSQQYKQQSSSKSMNSYSFSNSNRLQNVNAPSVNSSQKQVSLFNPKNQFNGYFTNIYY